MQGSGVEDFGLYLGTFEGLAWVGKPVVFQSRGRGFAGYP